MSDIKWLDVIHDDKNLVIFCLTVIAVFSIFYLPSPIQIVSDIVSGLLGVAVGRSTKT